MENQVQCQAECELENGCVGIAYSPTHEDGQYCYLCSYPVTLKDASNGFGFYKMPGVEGTTQWLFFTFLFKVNDFLIIFYLFLIFYISFVL